MALVQFSAFCAPVAAKGRAERFAAPAQSCVLRGQAAATQKRRQSTRRTGNLTVGGDQVLGLSLLIPWSSARRGAQ